MKPAKSSRYTVGVAIGRSLAVLIALGVTLYAAPGDLDPSFGSGGKVTTNFSSVGDSGDFAAAATGLFGFIVAAGQSNAAGSLDFAVARYAPNGALDPTLGASSQRG